MNNYNNLQQAVNKVNEKQNLDLVLNEEAKKDENVSVILQIIALIGGFFANSSFFGFLAVTGVLENEITLGILGLVLTSGIYVLHKKTDSVLIQTLLISTFLSGITCIIGALFILKLEANLIFSISLLIILASFYLYNNFIIKLLAVISFVITLSLFLNYNGLVYFLIFVDISVLIGLYVLLKKEAKCFESKKFSDFYQPLISGLQVLAIYSFFKPEEIIYSLFGNNNVDLSYLQYFTISNFVLEAGLFYWIVIDILKNRIKTNTKNIIWILIPLTLIVAGAYFDISILYGLCCILMAFTFKEKLFFGASVISLIYTLSRFYYNLNMSLLHKSELLMASGLVFLILYFLILKLTKNEKAIDSTHSN
nr:DUF4401 domain-containing protein [uncultured Flavobacterium sp.]